MSPPGLGMAHKRAGLRTPYWDWTARDGHVHYQKYAGTPPEHLLFALRAALDMISAERLKTKYSDAIACWPRPCVGL